MTSLFITANSALKKITAYKRLANSRFSMVVVFVAVVVDTDVVLLLLLATDT